MQLQISLLLMVFVSLSCGNPLDLCKRTGSSVGFFSQGDCRLTRATFFRGHEWLTWFANEDAIEGNRFSDEEIDAIVEGNRRVDFPKEFLVHLNHSVRAYAKKLQEYHDLPENQQLHFLLDERNTSAEARTDAVNGMRRRTKEAVGLWGNNRARALAVLGSIAHTLQDSFSHAHSVRDPNDNLLPWCITKVKAYLRRADGFDTADIEFHGGSGGDTVGHTTSEDSIYVEGRDCRDPKSKSEVEDCLSDESFRAIEATTIYLEIAHQAVTLIWDDATVDAALDPLFADHFSLCSEAASGP